MPRIPYAHKLPWVNKGPIIPVVRLTGVIGDAGRFRQGLNMAGVAQVLEQAFAMPGPAVALLINSPGGSPTQSDLIFKRIRALADEKNKKVLGFAEDLAASGGYLIALAADEIYATETSLVGSIGVVSGGFGFPALLEKLGVERRIYTAGENKARLDPFKPEDPEDLKRLEEIQLAVHEFFKNLVKERRGDRLKTTQKKAFSGDVWLGSEALKLGLIDGIGDVRSITREKYGKNVKLKVIEGKSGWLGKRLRMGMGSMGMGGQADWADNLVSSLEARALWGRFGL